MTAPTLLIVDAEPLVRWSLRERFSRDGYSVVEAGTVAEALERAAPGVDLVLLDHRLPDGTGPAVLQQMREAVRDTPMVVMTASSSIEDTVEAMKLGAYHCVSKPFDLDDVAAMVEKAIEAARLRGEVRAYRTSQGREFGFEAIVGESAAMTAAKALLARIARSPASTVLLTGETGTGKDLAARAIHYNSDRAAKPFVNLTCSALPEALLESQLFGHERGAFTGARQQRGLLETAEGGTVHLDGIGELPPGLQPKLLRFLEEKTFRRVGGSSDVRVDVRLIAATHRALDGEVASGRFRQDLLHQLQVMPIALPPLRERSGDIERLAHHYIRRYNGEFRKQVKGLQPGAMALLGRYRWPGNVRELRNAVERAMLLVEGDWLTPDDVGSLAGGGCGWVFRLPPEGIALEDVERQLLVQALDRCRGNRTRAGVLLGINRDQVRYRIEKFGLTRPPAAAPPAAGG